MISLDAFIVAVVAGSIPVAWFFVCRWFMSKDTAETELLDELGAAELTETQRSELASKAKASGEDAHPVGQLSHA